VEEVAHGLFARGSHNLVHLIDKNDREWAWLVDVLSIFRPVLSQTVTLLAYCYCEALHLILKSEAEISSWVFGPASFADGEVLSDRYANTWLTEVSEVILETNAENTVVFLLDLQVAAKLIRPQVRVVRPVAVPFSLAPRVA